MGLNKNVYNTFASYSPDDWLSCIKSCVDSLIQSHFASCFPNVDLWGLTKLSIPLDGLIKWQYGRDTSIHTENFHRLTHTPSHSNTLTYPLTHWHTHTHTHARTQTGKQSYEKLWDNIFLVGGRMDVALPVTRGTKGTGQPVPIVV